MAPSLIVLPLTVLLILCAMLHPSSASGRDSLMLDRFHRWMSVHGRSYPSANEKLRRLEAYRRNVELIEATNRESQRLGYKLGENEFTDLTNEEFVARYTRAAAPREDADTIDDGVGSSIITTLAGDVEEGRTSTVDLNASSPAPENWDWRDRGAVTPAKHQGHCGCGWAFAAVATVESENKIKTGELVQLSEQEVLDCDVLAGQSGCHGGNVGRALKWIRLRRGIVTEAEYPYTAQQSECQITDRAKHVGKLTNVSFVTGESQMELAILQRPVAVLIDVTGDVFQSYQSGIYKGPCTTRTNHAVVLIGYGVSSDGEKYWIVKNSWGDLWGQKGFFFMRRGANGEAGLCGVTLAGYYPVI